MGKKTNAAIGLMCADAGWTEITTNHTTRPSIAESRQFELR
jgi:hypothetical protein